MENKLRFFLELHKQHSNSGFKGKAFEFCVVLRLRIWAGSSKVNLNRMLYLVVTYPYSQPANHANFNHVFSLSRSLFIFCNEVRQTVLLFTLAVNNFILFAHFAFAYVDYIIIIIILIFPRRSLSICNLQTLFNSGSYTVMPNLNVKCKPTQQLFLTSYSRISVYKAFSIRNPIFFEV